MATSTKSISTLETRATHWRVRTASLVTKVLAISLLAVAPMSVLSAPAANAVTPAAAYTLRGLSCDATGDGDITVTPSHGQAFYVDGTPALDANDQDASYIGYQIGLKAGSGRSNIWVKISNFTSSVTTSTKGSQTIVAAAGATDSAQISNAVDSLTVSDTRTAFFFLKATSVNNWGNSDEATGTFRHNVEVFEGNPATGGTLLRSCTNTFTKIFSTTAASANKLTSLNVGNSAPKLGDTVTVTADGQTGTIGSGTSPDLDLIWLTAAPNSSWPINSLRLENVKFTGASGACATPRINQLLILNASSIGCQGNYTVIYTFRVIGAGPANQVVAPIAQIASGTQVKHTTVTSRSINLSGATASGIQMAKGIVSSTGTSDSVTVGSTYYARVVYVETATVASGSASLDFVVDSPTVGAILETLTVRATDLLGTNRTIVPTQSAGTSIFDGPFSFSSVKPLVITYSMLLPIPSVAPDNVFENIVWGSIGGQKIYANGGIPLVAVTVAPTGGTTVNIGFKLSKPGVATKPATDITDFTAIIHGTLEQKSETTTLYFDWGTDPTLNTSSRVNVGPTTTAPVDTSTPLSGLSRDTTYYFRIIGIGESGLTETGTILNFHTGYVRVWTLDATNVTFKKATLNGRYFDTQTAINADANYKIFYSTSSNIDSLTATFKDLGTTNAPFRDNVDTSTVLTGLDSNTVYYFRIIAFKPSGEQLAQGDILSFTTGSVTTNAASSVSTTGGTLNGSFTFGDDSATAMVVGFTYGTSPTLTTDSTTVLSAESPASYDRNISKVLSGLTSNTKYYFRAFAFDGSETITATIRDFTTSSPAAPAPTTPPVDIKWPNPGPLNYPTPLGGGQLNANATCNGQPVTGTYVYSPVLGTILDPGTYTLTVTFVPDASSGCRSAMTTVTIVVKAQEPTITWPTPEKELGPVTLGPKELNATCSVPGKMVYDPAAGTVLQPGTYTLKVTCIPTDPKLPPVSTTVILIVEAPLGTPQNGKTGPNTFTNGYIKWDPVVGATNYSVEIRGEIVCTTTTETTCTVDRTIGPKTPVIVNAFGKYNQKTSARAVYFNDKLLPAIVVNFATGSAVIDSKGLREVARVSAIVKLEGFTYVVITGHTDPRGGAINVALSKRRANSLKAEMLKLNSGLSFRDAGLAYNDPKASNKTASGMAMNRRSEGAVR